MAVVIIGMLDEREGALRIIKDQIERRGHKTVLIDVSMGVGGIVSSLRGDVSPEEIMQLGGGCLDEVDARLVTERDRVASIMAEGLTKKLLDLYGNGEVEAAIAIAGMTGTYLSLTAMNALPFGVPKLMVSSVVAMPAYASWLAEHVWLRDITVMNTMVDTVGMNRLVNLIALNGANAIAGMMETSKNPPLSERRTSFVMTEFAFCDAGAHYVREILDKDYEIVSFHSQGLGDRAAVDSVDQGLFDGFIDLAPGGFSEYLLGGNRASGPNRLDGAMDMPIPYILSPCGFDMISCGPIERKLERDGLWASRKLSERKLFFQDSVRIQARTTPEEMQQIGRAVAEKLNRRTYKKMVKFVIPMKGFSSLSGAGGALYDPQSDEAFIVALKESLDPEIEVIEINTDINTREFAAAVANVLTCMQRKTQ
jgi:uncharacterized protein (UPF0261 family)